MDSPDIAKLYLAVVEAERTHKASYARESVARVETTAALNQLNNAQKAFDEAVAAAKKSAPQDSDWRRPTWMPVVDGMIEAGS